MMPKLNARIQCADFASVSIQANRYSYCTPRNDTGPYTDIEAGFPSVPPPASWLAYIDGDPDKPCETVYGYMPIACVREFIDAHGGMVSGELPPFAEPVSVGAVDPQASSTGKPAPREGKSSSLVVPFVQQRRTR